jgi:hypothetical protein
MAKIQWPKYNGQNTMDKIQWPKYNGQNTMDKQWSTKHYPENLRLSNKNPTKNWE